MNGRNKWPMTFLVALPGLTVWNVARRGNENARDATREAGTKPGETGKTPSVSEVRDMGNKRPEGNAAEVNPALDGVRSPLARRYLSHLMAKDGRFVNDRNGLWLVNNAFERAWMLTSRMDLSEEQQATFRNLLAGQKDGIAGMMELTGTIAQKNSEPNDEKTKQLSANEQKELGQSMVGQAHVYQDHNTLADRIPMTAEEQEKVLDALRSGAKPPVVAQDHEMLEPARAEAAVRSDTAWLGKLIPEARYETCVEHFLVQVGMSRFHLNRRKPPKP